MNLFFQTYEFDGYVFEMWNQFVFSGAKKKLIIELIISIANGLQKKDLYTILAVPPFRGYKILQKNFFFLLNNNNFNKHFLLTEWIKNFFQKEILKLYLLMYGIFH